MADTPNIDAADARAAARAEREAVRKIMKDNNVDYAVALRMRAGTWHELPQEDPGT